MLVKDLLKTIDSIAPFESAEDYDNVGLLLGNPKEEVKGIVYCLDCTMDVVKYATAVNANVIVCHHPLIFGGIQSIFTDEPKGAIIKRLLGNDIHLIAVHTNLDLAEMGTAFALADRLGLQNIYVPADNPFMRIAQLEEPMSALELNALMTERLGSPSRVFGDSKRKVQILALSPGAADDGYLVALQHQAEAFVCGEMKHHLILDACARGLLVFDNGHYANEAPVMAVLMKQVAEIHPELFMSNYEENPFVRAI